MVEPKRSKTQFNSESARKAAARSAEVRRQKRDEKASLSGGDEGIEEVLRAVMASKTSSDQAKVAAVRVLHDIQGGTSDVAPQAVADIRSLEDAALHRLASRLLPTGIRPMVDANPSNPSTSLKDVFERGDASNGAALSDGG